MVVGAPEGGDEAVDAVAGVGEDLGDVPLTQPRQDLIGDVGHGVPLKCLGR